MKLKIASRLLFIAMGCSALLLTACTTTTAVVGGAAAAAIVPTKSPLPPGFTESNVFGCNGGKQFVASFEPEGTSAAITFDRGRTRMLTRDASGIYKDNDISLIVNEAGVIQVSRDSVPIFDNCILVSKQPAYYGRKTRFRLWNPDKDLNFDH